MSATRTPASGDVVDFNESTALELVLATVKNTPDPRNKALFESLLRHLLGEGGRRERAGRQQAGDKRQRGAAWFEGQFIGHETSHRREAAAQENIPPRNWNTCRRCRSFQVANNIKPSTSASPTL